VLDAALALSRPIETPTHVRGALGNQVVDIIRADAERLRAHTGLALDHWSVFADSRAAMEVTVGSAS
jgi:hypothetical protein